MVNASRLSGILLLFPTLVKDTQSKSINATGGRTQGKHEFIKIMRLSQKTNGKIPRKLNYEQLVAKSVHKPGLRSSSMRQAVSSSIKNHKISTKDSIVLSPPNAAAAAKALQDDKGEANRHLGWWNWWASQSQGSEGTSGQQMANDTEAAEDYTDNRGSWWNFNGWGKNSSAADEDDMWSADENQTMVMESLADFSIKYAGCSALTSFMDSSSNEDGSYPFVNQNFVTYRLCPSESCTDDSWRGCKSDYGEYLMNLEDFLSVQQDYLDEEFEYYCNYCGQCLYFDQYFTEDGEGCIHSEDCEDYLDYCSDEARRQMENEAEFSLEDFFECKEIELNTGYYGGDDGGNNITVTDDMVVDAKYDAAFKNSDNKAYIGVHCNNGVIEIGLFADEQCIHYVGNQIDFFNATGYEIEASAVQEMYVPQGCLACNGDNIKTSGYWFPLDDREGEEYQQEQEQEDFQYISEICYNMYTQSAKCHIHYSDNSNMALELSESEALNEQVACDFIEDVVKGYVNDEGFVYSHQRQVSNPITQYFSMFGADDMDTEVTGMQYFGLFLTGTATIAMAVAAFHLKRKIVDSSAVVNLREGLLI